MNELEQLDGNRIISRFLSHLDADFFTLISVDSRHWRLARSYIGLFNTPLRTLDALHLAIASLEEFELFTSDQQLVQAAAVLGVKIRTINLCR
jgi:predicted nucleic acid-binding protein